MTGIVFGDVSGARVPDIAEPVLGWRSWRVDGDRLISQWGRTEWPPDEWLKAGCVDPPWAFGPFYTKTVPCRSTPSQKTVGHAGHGCGIYAYTDDGIPQRNARAGDHVWGCVKLAGRVVVHDHGFRAELAYPSLLVTPVHADGHAFASDVRRVARVYGVSVTDERDLGDWLAEEIGAAAAALISAFGKLRKKERDG